MKEWNKEYWLHHLQRLAANNAHYKEELRLTQKQVLLLTEELEHYCKIIKEQNARILTLEIVKGCLGP